MIKVRYGVFLTRMTFKLTDSTAQSKEQKPTLIIIQIYSVTPPGAISASNSGFFFISVFILTTIIEAIILGSFQISLKNMVLKSTKRTQPTYLVS